jgi:hypothetical protein
VNKSRRKIGFILVGIGTFSIATYILPFRVKVAQAISGAFKFKLPPPPDRGIAGNRGGAGSQIRMEGASRTKNPFNTLTTKALVPEYRNSPSTGTSKLEPTKVWGLTVNKYPTLWFYIPPYDNIEHINFILYNGDKSVRRAVYQTSFQPPQREGIINLSVPKVSVPLETDKLYQWELKLTIKSQPSPQNTTPSKVEEIVTGWIQRKSLNQELSDRIKQSNPRQQAAIYAENGFWYDALSTLALLRRDVPQDLAVQQDWEAILKSVDLGELADKPFTK